MDEPLEKEQNVIELAEKLSKALTESKEYRAYRKYLVEIKNDEELFKKVNNFRRNNFEIQNRSGGRLSYEEYSALYDEESELRRNRSVNGFLEAEAGLGRLVKEVINKIVGDIDIDCDFLK